MDCLTIKPHGRKNSSVRMLQVPVCHDSLTIVSHVLHHHSPQLSSQYHDSAKKKPYLFTGPEISKWKKQVHSMQCNKALSLTPCLRSTLRTAHVTPAFMRRKQDAHSLGRPRQHARVYTNQSLKASCFQGYQRSEGGWCLFSFEAHFPSPVVS